MIEYYSREEFPAILEESINNCVELVEDEITLPMEALWKRVQEHNHGSPGNRVYPMEQRLGSIFQIEEEEMLGELCTAFMKPIFRTSKLYDDVLPALRELKRRGYKVAILTNTPWGCPSNLWLTELTRYGISEYIDEAVCGYDVGWRKPDPRPFKHLLEKLKVEPEECLFIGDNPQWDMEGPKALGMKALLIDRTGMKPDAVHGLDEVLDVLVEDVLRE